MFKKGFYSFVIISTLLTSACHAKEKTQQLVDRSLSDMVRIPAGMYTMGATRPDWQSGNTTPPHKVVLTGFYMSRMSTSYGEYDTYTEITGKPYIQKQYMKKWDFFRNKEHPVNNGTWYQANAYCTWLAKTTGLPFSLPTEAQYEYVARNLGRSNWAFATNNGKQELGENFPNDNMFDNQKGNVSKGNMPLPVGSLPCTPMGICGLNGEVEQWMKDWYSPNYYKNSPVHNPQGPATGTKKSVRGGGAGGSPEFNNNFGRYGWLPSTKFAGFRCVINSDKPLSELKAIAVQHINQ